MTKRTVLLLVAFCLSVVAASFAADSNVGTWKLNEKKSKIPAGAAKNNTVVYTAEGDSYKCVVDGTDGGLAGLLMDFEGIPVETYSRSDSGFDIESVGAEVSVVVKAIQRASEMLDAGPTREVAFRSDKLVTLIRVINESYFVAVALSPEGNLGKGRYLLRIVAPQLAQELDS